MSGVDLANGGVRKRFWTLAHAEAGADGFRILLDARPVRLPGGAPLLLRSSVLATAVAAEWSEVGAVFGPESLPLTRLCGTMQERVAPNRAHAVATLLGFAESDLLCYRAAHPVSLVQRQEQDWQPWLDWAAQRFDACLSVTVGVVPIAQPPEAIASLGRALEASSDAALTGLGVLVPALGSLVLGLAVADRVLAAEAALELALLDEKFQAERWGADADETDRQAVLAVEVASAARFLALSAEG